MQRTETFFPLSKNEIMAHKLESGDERKTIRAKRFSKFFLFPTLSFRFFFLFSNRIQWDFEMPACVSSPATLTFFLDLIQIIGLGSALRQCPCAHMKKMVFGPGVVRALRKMRPTEHWENDHYLHVDYSYGRMFLSYLTDTSRGPPAFAKEFFEPKGLFLQEEETT